MKSLIIAVLAFALGFATHWGILNLQDPSIIDVAHHWSRVNKYNEYMRDPKNYTNKSNGLVGATVPFAPEPSLAALVAADELTYVDIVLPIVPNNPASSRHWMKFVQARPDTIVYATANPEYVAYKPTGDVPLHLQLWFTESAAADVQQLIAELESLPEPGR